MKRPHSLASPDSSPERPPPPRKRRHVGTPFPASSDSGKPSDSDASPFKEPGLPASKVNDTNSTIPFPTTPNKNKVFSNSSASSSSSSLPPMPFDSPNNPLGRCMSISLQQNLPERTPYRTHVPLRFQFVRSKSARPQAGIHRIVQVPRNYTFAHLRALISWIFQTDMCEPLNVKNRNGRLFQLYEYTEVWCEPRAGEISKGHLWANVSNDRNPYMFRDEDEKDEEMRVWIEDLHKDPDAKVDDEHWEEEEDFTVGHVWIPKSRKTRAVRFSPICGEKFSIHITQYAGPLVEPRIGFSNIPRVLEAHGRVRPYPSTGASYVFDSDGEEEDSDPAYDEFSRVPLDIRWWNEKRCFESFYRKINTPLGADYEEEFPTPATPDLTWSSDPPSFDSFSSPENDRTFFSSPATSSRNIVPSFSPNRLLPASTPLPALSSLRRLSNLHKRMEHFKHKIRAPRYSKTSKDPEDRPPDEQEYLMDKLPSEGTPKEVKATKERVEARSREGWKPSTRVKVIRGGSEFLEIEEMEKKKKVEAMKPKPVVKPRKQRAESVEC